MRRAGTGTVIGIAATVGLVVFGAANCASPTQIIVSVRAEPSLCSGGAQGINETGIAVSTRAKVDEDPLDVTEPNGCNEDSSIGDLTITPRGDEGAEVAIRVVAALGKKFAAQCTPEDTDGCIIQHRYERFLANQTVRIEVFLSQRCVGVKCGGGECNPLTGQCVDAIQSDGAVATPPPPKDAGKDAAFDAKVDPCIDCDGQCDPVKKTCIVQCAATGCAKKTFSSPDLTYTIQCSAGLGNCTDTHCISPGGRCAFFCEGAGTPASCTGIACAAGTCFIDCGSVAGACSDVRVDSGVNEVRCGPGVAATCNDVSCAGDPDAGCVRSCAGLQHEACGLTTSCVPEAGCANWQINDGG